MSLDPSFECSLFHWMRFTYYVKCRMLCTGLLNPESISHERVCIQRLGIGDKNLTNITKRRHFAAWRAEANFESRHSTLDTRWTHVLWSLESECGVPVLGKHSTSEICEKNGRTAHHLALFRLLWLSLRSRQWSWGADHFSLCCCLILISSCISPPLSCYRGPSPISPSIHS